jgi:hypothetical protein
MSLRIRIRSALARFAPRAVRFLSTHTGVFRVVGLVGIAFSIVAIAIGNNLEAAALAVIGCEFFISSVLIDQFNAVVARLGGGGGGLRTVFVPVPAAGSAAASDDEDEAGEDDGEAGEDDGEAGEDEDDSDGDDNEESDDEPVRERNFAVN